MNRKPPASNEDLEGEEEFYYTEIEVPLTVTSDFALLLGASACSRSPGSSQQVASLAKSLFSTSAPASVAAAANILQSCLPSNLADHMDMARPPHENPEYNFAHQSSSNDVASVAVAAAAAASASASQVVATSVANR